MMMTDQEVGLGVGQGGRGRDWGNGEGRVQNTHAYRKHSSWHSPFGHKWKPKSSAPPNVSLKITRALSQRPGVQQVQSWRLGNQIYKTGIKVVCVAMHTVRSISTGR